MNKSDTINKEYLLAEIDDLADEFSEIDENGLHSERWCGIMDAKQIIINAPFVSDRPQGEWIVNISDYKSMCSVCGANETHFIYGTEMWYGLGKSKFCPYCGARMKGADNETEMS